MAFRWRADDGPTLNPGLVAAIFQGIRTCVAGKPYIFVIFQGGGRGVRTPCPPLWIQPDSGDITPKKFSYLDLWKVDSYSKKTIPLTFICNLVKLTFRLEDV